MKIMNTTNKKITLHKGQTLDDAQDIHWDEIVDTEPNKSNEDESVNRITEQKEPIEPNQLKRISKGLFVQKNASF